MAKNDKVSVFYGRARRIEFAEKVAYIVTAIIALIVVVVIVTKQSDSGEANVNFSYLRQYFTDRGYNCEMIHRAGGRCVFDNGITIYSFVRNEDGFEYLVRTNSYLLEMTHSLDDENAIVFKTTSEAFAGYKNKSYTCEFKDNVLGELGVCQTLEGEQLNLRSYIGVIEHAQNDLNLIIDSSGYYKTNLLQDYQWVKK